MAKRLQSSNMFEYIALSSCAVPVVFNFSLQSGLQAEPPSKDRTNSSRCNLIVLFPFGHLFPQGLWSVSQSVYQKLAAAGHELGSGGGGLLGSFLVSWRRSLDCRTPGQDSLAHSFGEMFLHLLMSMLQFIAHNVEAQRFTQQAVSKFPAMVMLYCGILMQLWDAYMVFLLFVTLLSHENLTW